MCTNWETPPAVISSGDFFGHLESVCVGIREVHGTVSTMVSMTPMGFSTQRSTATELNQLIVQWYSTVHVHQSFLHLSDVHSVPVPYSTGNGT